MRRIPLNFFGMPFGLCGLAACWLSAAGCGLVPAAVGEVVIGVAATVWLVVLAVYLRYVAADPAAFHRDLSDLVHGTLLPPVVRVVAHA